MPNPVVTSITMSSKCILLLTFTGFICCKVISVYPGNCDRSPPLSSHQGVVLLFESRSGQLISVADAHEITALRTAAASAVATKYIVGAKKEVHVSTV